MLTRAFTLALLITAPFAARAQAGDPAMVRLEAYGRAVGAVAREAAALGFKARVERFVPVIVDCYDLQGSLGIIAGSAWTNASAADRATATAAFARNGAIQHAQNFTAPDFKLAVDPQVKTRGTDRLVRAHIGTETLIYRLRESGGRWRILDVLARGGVSQLAIQRDGFAATIKQGGLPALTAKLNEINARPH